VKPAWLDGLQTFDLASLPDLRGNDERPSNGAKMDAGRRNVEGAGNAPHARPRDILLALLASPEIASKRIVWRQYDHQVLTNTVAGPGADAALIRIKPDLTPGSFPKGKGSSKALAISTDGNARYTYLDPYAGGAIAVAEAARNVACSGARPLAMTNCLNFGNPEKAEVYWQLSEAIRGMADAARALEVPVISGNVSLYNETNGEAIWPTPVAGVVGLIEDAERAVPAAFSEAGLRVFAIGAEPQVEDLAGSEYLLHLRGEIAGRPRIDIDGAVRLQRFLIDASGAGLLRSAHDVSAGGLAVTLAECCMDGVGLEGAAFEAARLDAALFGETQSRVVVSCDASDEVRVREMAGEHGLPVVVLGTTGAERMRIGPIDVSVGEMRDAYERGLPEAMAGVDVRS
jgi:phosphoribosylformylglycinamidine (FGAM) synthase-like enzyme